MSDAVQRPLPVWAIYVFMVICFVFTSYVPNVSLLWVVIIIASYVARSIVRKAGAELEVSHASWQIRTLWIWLGLFCLLVTAALVVLGVIGTGDVLVQVEAITKSAETGAITPMQMLAEIWKIEAIRTTIYVVIVLGILFAVWPLKRTLQGIMGMLSGLAPDQLPASRGWLALGGSVLIQVILPFAYLIVFGS